MRTIYAWVLYAREQGDAVCVWAIVDTDNPPAIQWMPRPGDAELSWLRDGAYVGSAHLYGAALVFHVFDLGAARATR